MAPVSSHAARPLAVRRNPPYFSGASGVRNARRHVHQPVRLQLDRRHREPRPAHYVLPVIDVEPELLTAILSLAAEHHISWDLVVASDDFAKGRDWENLLRLARRTGDAVKQALLAARKPLLLVRAAILARYILLDLIEALQQSSGPRGGVPAVWLLIPGGEPRLDGVIVPLETSGQKAIVSHGWIQKHRPRP